MMRATRGFALPVLLVLLLALTTLAHASLVLARGELQSTFSFRHAVRARWAAEAAPRLFADTLLALWSERRPGDSVALIQADMEEGITTGVALRWLTREFFLLEGSGQSDGWVGKQRLHWLGWSIHPEERLAALPGVLSVGGLVLRALGSTVDGGRPDGLPTDWDPGSCDAFQEAIDSVYADGGLVPVERWVPPPVDASGLDGGRAPSPVPWLGLLGGGILLPLTEDPPGGTAISGNGGPAPGCPGEGAPLLMGRKGSLVLDGGRLCGLLVVEEDLTLMGEAVFQGLALVGGNLTMGGESRVEGLAKVRGNLRMEDTARARGLACPVLRTLDHASRHWGSHLLSQAGRLPAF